LKATGASSYQWINSTTGLSTTQVGNPVATPVANISYTLVGSDPYNCFKDTAVVNVTVQPLPTVMGEPDIDMIAAETHQLTATASADVVSWKWSPDDYLSCTACPSPITTPRMPMDYVVMVKNQWGCAASDTVAVRLQCSDGFVFIPNTFTPNNDGKNDVFYIKGKGIGIIKSLIIYNRWGEVVFEKKNFNIDDKAAAWDGKYKGVLAPVGSYVYFAEMQCDAGEPILRKGTVTVVY
jgi:gliding motility-associated-like protein